MKEALPAYDPRLGRGVRLAMVLVAVGLSAVFAIALWLKPDPRGMGTHQQLGLPPCTFSWLSGLPCPSCGMTTSFSHLIRGQIVGSLRANPVGTLLGLFCLALIPYCGICAALGRRLFFKDYETLLNRAVIVLLVLLFSVWGIRLAVIWATQGQLFQRPLKLGVSEPGGSPSLFTLSLKRSGHEIDPRTVFGCGAAGGLVPGGRLSDAGPFLCRCHHDGLRPAHRAPLQVS